jgi:UDP-N-acetyl-2-amino-2-deoxyglucuronate dehydrogenase
MSNPEGIAIDSASGLLTSAGRQTSHNFAITGVAGYVAPRHLQAIKDVGGRLIAALDPHDSVGILDRYQGDAAFFTEFERFDRHIEKLRRGPPEGRLHYLSICAPNHLHDAHIRFALRVGAHALCEKPLVLNPWNLDALEQLEQESGRRVYTILQLRVHPAIVALRESLAASGARKHDVELTYCTPRGVWYRHSWKGSTEKSGGIATNIGIHLFDLLIWLFGRVESSELHVSDGTRAGGALELERARVRWFLSIDPSDSSAQRNLIVDGRATEFTHGFADLHSRVYAETLAGRGFGIADARPAIELAHRIRTGALVAPTSDAHPRVLALRA